MAERIEIGRGLDARNHELGYARIDEAKQRKCCLRRQPRQVCETGIGVCIVCNPMNRQCEANLALPTVPCRRRADPACQ